MKSRGLVRRWTRIRERRRGRRAVAISYLNEHEDAAETRRWVEEAGRRAVTVPGDVADHEHCREVVRRAVDELGGIDIAPAFVFSHRPSAPASAAPEPAPGGT